MPREEDPIQKEESLGNVVKVQQVIDFIVLSKLMEEKRLYHSKMKRFIIDTLDGVGVNEAYFSKRLQTLAEKGHVIREWEDENRYNRFYEITDSGVDYFKRLLQELPDRVKMAQRVYELFDQYLGKFGKMNLK